MRKILAFIFVFTILIAGCTNKPAPTVPNNAVNNTPTVNNQTKNISLYFSDKVGKLVKESRQIELKQNEVLEKRIIEELIKGPSTQHLSPTISQLTKVNSVTVKNGTAVVDLSEEFITKSPGGSESEELAIYSVVNTMTDLIYVDKVQFLIDGKVRKIFSHMELEGDFERDDNMVKTI